MQTIIPSSSDALKSLLRADFTTQWKNRRALIMLLLVPVIILISWKGLVAKLGGAFVLSTCITIGLNAIGLMGYANSVARDRDKGVFQRLRVAPVPTWSIMISRLSVQLTMIIIVTLLVFVAGFYFDKITIPFTGYALGFLAAILGGAVYLSIGQTIVGLVKNPETVNVTSRLVYFLFIMIGMFGELGMLGDGIKEAVKWSPYGTVNRIVSGGLNPDTWTSQTTLALLVTAGYTAIFTTLGIRFFKWSSR